jgi:hypothetical protein
LRGRAMPSGEMPREEGNFDTLFLARQHCYAIKFVLLPICLVAAFTRSWMIIPA